MKDIPRYTHLGAVLPGDYYPEIPYDDYIRKDLPLPEAKSPDVFDIRDFGAVPDTEEVQTEAIERAMTTCAAAGGGTVLIAGGSYISGAVRIPSHTTLFIAPDSRLIAARDPELLIRYQGTREDRVSAESSGGAFVSAIDAEDVRITGGGTISGQGEWFVHPPRKIPALVPFEATMIPRRDQTDVINTLPGSTRTEYRDRIRYAEDKYNEGLENLRRPSYMVWFCRCRGVEIDNILLHDAMCWTLHAEACDEVKIHDLVIDDNRHVANTDGIDISGCHDTRIEHCFVSCADDGLCLKNPDYTGRALENAVIRDCHVMTVMNAFKIGTGTRHDIRDVLVEDCVFEMPDIYPGTVCGIAIESCDGSVVENVTIRNIRMDQVVCPIYVLLNRRNEANGPYSEEENALYWGGVIRDIQIENMHAAGAELPCIITGYEDRTREGKRIRKAPREIELKDVEIGYRDNQERIDIPEDFGEFLTDYPESNAHGDVDACGFWVRHADRIRFRNVKITPRSVNTRPLFAFHDADGSIE